MADQDFMEDTQTRQAPSLPGESGKPVVTWVLIGINGLIWLGLEGAGGSEDPDVLLDFGALYGPLIANGEYWRIFTAMFLHVGLMHLVVNSFGLLIFGNMVERVYGHLRFGIIYVLAGLAGSVASYLMNSIAIGAGASGAIFGVLGAFAAYLTARRGLLGEMGRQSLVGVLVLAAIQLAHGFATPGIDNWAHMGGLVTGFAVGLAFAPHYKVWTDPVGTVRRVADTNSAIKQWWVLPVVALVLLAGIRLGAATLADNPLSHVVRAEGHMQEGDYNQAFEEIAQAIELDPLIGQAYYLRARILADLQDPDRALSDLSKAFKYGLDVESMREALALLVKLRAQQR